MPPPGRRPATRGRVYMRYRTWWIDFTIGGQRVRRSTTARTRSEAYTALREAIMAATGQAPAESPTSLDEALSMWSEERHRHEVARVRRIIDHLGGHRRLDDIEPAEIVRWGELRTRKVRPTTVHREVSLLSSLYTWAIPRGFARRNPIRDAPRPKTDRPRREGLTPEDARALLATTKGHPLLEPAYRLALYAGLRREEIVRLRWDDVDLDAGTLFVREGKTALSTATIPLHPELAAYLRARPREGDHVIVGRHGGGVEPDALQTARRRFGRPLPPFHRMRHTLATMLVRAGVDMARISKILRHSSVRTTDSFYAHLRPIDCASDLGMISLDETQNRQRGKNSSP